MWRDSVHLIHGLCLSFCDAVHWTGACTCNDPSGNCIMASVSGNPPPSLWSSCSQDDLETGFEDLGLNSCLTNEPAVFVGDPVCGNGLKEEGEACDCGSEEVCVFKSRGGGGGVGLGLGA